MVDQQHLFHLSKMASHAEAGWFWVELRPGVKGLVHEERDCTHSDCPRAVDKHRHRATPEQRQVMQGHITQYLRLRFERECEQARLSRDVAELRRMMDL